MSSGLIFQPLLGWLIDKTWSGEMNAQNIKVYSVLNYQYSFVAVIAALFVGLIIIQFFVKETLDKKS